MSRTGVSLDAISAALQGVIPSPLATCALDGTPNITYMSIVQQVDRDRVAIPRQHLNKTAANLRANTSAQALVVDPATMNQYLLDLVYLRTETAGPVFEAMRSSIEATPGGPDGVRVHALRGIDIHWVTACSSLHEGVDTPRYEGLDGDTLRLLDHFVHRVAAAADSEDAVREALAGLDDVFGFGHAAVLGSGNHADPRLADLTRATDATPRDELARLVAAAAERRHVICVPNLPRRLAMVVPERDHVLARSARLVDSAPLLSVAAVPLVAGQSVLGVLYLESEQAGRFGPHNEHLLRIIGTHLAVTMSALEMGQARSPTRRADVTYYQADDSVFVDGEYLIKGVPGRILWKLLRENAQAGRVSFTNRELRLDESLELPPGNDNLDSRLIALRRRLQARECGIELDRVARGKLALRVSRRLSLTEIPTSGLMGRPLSVSAIA